MIVEEEKKEEEPKKSEAQIQAEEEKTIMEVPDEKERSSRYLNFLMTVKNVSDDKEGPQDFIPIEGTMFTETSLFRTIKLLDQLITLSDSGEEGYQIVQQFSDPENLRHVIELSVEASAENQIVVQRVLQ